MSVAMRDLGVMGRLFVMAARMMLGRFMVVLGGVLVMLGRFAVMVCCFLGHELLLGVKGIPICGECSRTSA
jgi:hypothetical protein